MKIYLIRHGIAVDASKHPESDETRPLTDEGVEKTKKVAQKINDLGIKFNAILSSPLVRAKQTAEIFSAILGNPPYQILEELAPNGKIQGLLDWFKTNHDIHSKVCDSIALIGHQPDLGIWTELLVWGVNQFGIKIKKAGVVGISIPDQFPYMGHGEIFWLTSPKYLLN